MDKVVINQLPTENLRGRRVFVRIDVDTDPSFSGVLLDDGKLRSSLPTLKYLAGVGARIIIGTHLGNPGGRAVASLSLDPVAGRLSGLLGRPVRKLGEAVGRDVAQAVAAMRDGDLLLLENLRFYPGEDANDAEFAHELAGICDVYCNDAFALAHCATASTVGITRDVRPATAGLEFAGELRIFEAVLDRPRPPFVGLIAGAQIEEKLPILENLMPRFDRLFIGGALSSIFLKAKRREIGAVSVDGAFLPLAKDLLKRAKKRGIEIILPQDFVAVPADRFRAYEEGGRRGAVPEWRIEFENGIPPSYLPVDVGPSTVDCIRRLFEKAQTILWTGPLGIWEVEPFGAATRAVAMLMMDRFSPINRRSLVCGDSLSLAIRSFNLPVESIRYLTTGSESAHQLLMGNPLPAVSALDDEAGMVLPVETGPRRILIPVDGSEDSLEVARRLSRLVDAGSAEISLLHVQRPGDFETGRERIDPEMVQEREVRRRLEAERIFDAIDASLAERGLRSRRRSVVEGDPANEISNFADGIGADLIVMGLHERAGLLRLLMGSVTRKVLDRVRCPVMIVRFGSTGQDRNGALKF